MEFFIGALTSLICMFVFYKMINDNKKQGFKMIKPIHSQSFLHDTIGPIAGLVYDIAKQSRELETQATNHFYSLHVKVAFSENMAYWIENNSLLSAQLDDGTFDKKDGKLVDTMGMSSVELSKIELIVEQLTEADKYDSGNPGNKGLR